MTGRFGGLVVCQGKGKPKSSEQCKTTEKAIDVNVGFRIIADVKILAMTGDVWLLY